MQSLSEIDTTSKRASKAAGFSWGVAEEIGKAIRNLELFGFHTVFTILLLLHFSVVQCLQPELLE